MLPDIHGRHVPETEIVERELESEQRKSKPGKRI